MRRSILLVLWLGLLGACSDDDEGGRPTEEEPTAAAPESPGSGESSESSGSTGEADRCDRALRTERLDFEGLTEGQRVAGTFADRGVSFYAGNIGPATANAFGSPASGRVYVAGDHEAVDDNPTEEHGNGEPAHPVTFWLHAPGAPDRPAVTDVVRMQLVWTNEGSVSRVEAYAPDGTKIDQQDFLGEGGDATQSVCIREDGIHRVVARFGPGTPDGPMEDNAGIDVVELGPIEPVD